MRIFPDIHRVDGVQCNVYLIEESDGLTVIDAGMPGADKRILAAIQQLGHTPRDVRRILITHQHVDHVGGLAALAKATGAETWAHPLDTPAIEGRGPRDLPSGAVGVAMRVLFVSRLRPAAVNHAAREGDTLPAFASEGGLRVVETFGHTVGHISLYLPARKLLFAGDAVMSRGGKLVLPPRMLNTNSAMAMESMRKLATLDVEACLTGHGEPILTGARELLVAGANRRLASVG